MLTNDVVSFEQLGPGENEELCANEVLYSHELNLPAAGLKSGVQTVLPCGCFY